MGKLTYYVMASLDGFIAREDGSFADFEWDDDFIADFLADLERFGTVLMGRKTYDIGLSEGKTSPYPAMRQIVFSQTMQTSPDKDVELVREDIPGFVRHLKASSEKPVWLCGGADIASTLASEGLIDHVIIKLNPVVFGTGISLFNEQVHLCKLVLQDTRVYSSGIVLLSYNVKKE